jgi:hypothetical protein
MMRQANSALRELRRMQAERRKLEADQNARTRRDWADHCATAAMAEALQDLYATASGDFAVTPSPPTSDAAIEPVMAGLDPAISEPRGIAGSSPAIAVHASASDEPAPKPRPEPQPATAPPNPLEEPDPDPVAEAELYATIYPERAALIRRVGGMPADATFGPPDDDVMQALITARTPALAALDRARAA